VPAGSRSLIVGAGIAGVAPFVVDQFLFVSNVSPQEAQSSARLIRRATSIEILGDGANSTCIGSNADANGDEAIVIGRDCSQTGVGANTDTIVIGQNVDHTGVGGQQAILIGNNTSLSGGSLVFIGSTGSALGAAGSFVAIGTALSISGTFNGVVIGNGAGSSGGNAVAIGGSGASASSGGVTVGSGSTMNSSTSNNVLIGQGQTVSGATSSQCILIGQACLTNTANVIFIGANLRTDNGVYASGDVVVGNNNTGGGGFSSRVIWFGDTHTSGVAVPAAAMRWKNAAGTNIAAGNLTLTGPLSTGNAAPAAILLQVGATGASGAALQAATTVARVVGAAAPFFEISVDRGLQFVGQTNQAAAAVGTLNNAPAAGDPAIWVPIVVNGVNRSFPAW
jgi:hypothetical protein